MPTTSPPAADTGPLSDDELAAAALAADPDTTVADDALSIWELADDGEVPPLLPAWYMPRPQRRSSGLCHRLVIGVVVAAFVCINAAGLCSTYGSVGWG